MAPQAAWYDSSLFKNLAFQEISTWLMANKKNPTLKINHIDIRKLMRQGNNHTLVIYIP